MSTQRREAMFTLLAPAKINLCLKVLGKRPDGYHEIESVMQAVSLFDRLTFLPAPKIIVRTQGAKIPQKDNLVTKALTLLQKYAGTRKGLRVTIKKNIPTAAGMGGGSSDAAAALLGACRAWRLPLSVAELAYLGARIGSDVPFFFTSGQALARGRGEKLLPLRLPTGYELLLACPDFPVYAPWAYGALNLGLTTGQGKDTFSPIRHSEVIGEDLRLSPRAGCFSNDLEAPVFGRYPQVEEVKKALWSAGFDPVLMSGSGPALWAAFPKHREDAGLPQNAARRATMTKIKSKLGRSAKVRLWTVHPLAACLGQPVGGQPL